MNIGNEKLAARFREMAATLGKDIAQRNRPRLENTPKRAREAASVREEARRLEKIQAALIGLAEAHEQNRVPQVLVNITSKIQIEGLLRAYSPTVTEQQQRDALIALSNPQAGQVTAADKIREIERQLVGRKIDGFFPTPAELVRAMLRYADIQPGDKVLEPSAGKGNIADLVREMHPSAQLDVIECNHALREILIYKGHNLIGIDCLEVHSPIYNVVVMNPPFEKLADIDHLQHCFNHLLADGGRLVSIMGESAFFRQDKKALAFRAWLAELGGSVVDIPAGAFKESGTGVKTRMIIVDKPESEMFPISQLEPEAEVSPLELDDAPQPQFITSGEAAELLISLMEDIPQQPVNAAPTLVNISPESEPEESAPDLVGVERGMQKALEGFGANDKLLKLYQKMMF